jgi:TRL (tRNA-associated locus)-like protein
VKKVMLAGMLVVAGMLSGCATSMPIGSLYTELKLPITATANQGRKEGTAECKSILTLVAIGDCSIETAKKKGGITKVSSVNWEATNILGIIGEYKVHVVGE